MIGPLTDENTQRRWGCSVAQYLGLRGKPMRTFQIQRNFARTRGIKWEFNLWQWWTLWQDSGRWEERGNPGYVMCRKGDAGPYHPDNVYIATNVQNIQDGFKNRNGRRSKQGASAFTSQLSSKSISVEASSSSTAGSVS